MTVSASTQPPSGRGPANGGLQGYHHHTLRHAYLGTKPQSGTLKALVHMPQSLPHQCTSYTGRSALMSLLGDSSAHVKVTFKHP
jgi:hypothetical protein